MTVLAALLAAAFPRRAGRIAALWFGLEAPVSRKAYAFSGVLLMGLKYVIDSALVRAGTGAVLDPLQFFAPLLSLREKAYAGAPDWLLPALGILALTFLWVGLTMSVRRAADAGLSPWFGLLFAVPLINFLLMLGLAILRSAPARVSWTSAPPSTRGPVTTGVSAALAGVGTASLIAIPTVATFASGFAAYGTLLFFVTPLCMGAVSAAVYNWRFRRGVGKTIAVALAGGAVSGAALLLFALEGAVCLAMAAPIGAIALVIGAVIGRAIVDKEPGAPWRPDILALLPVLPIGLLEPYQQPPLYEVISSVEIDAPPDVVWRRVIAFPPLPAPHKWWFRTGIAYPT